MTDRQKIAKSGLDLAIDTPWDLDANQYRPSRLARWACALLNRLLPT